MRVLTESAERFVILLLQTQLVDEQSKVKDQQLGEARPVRRWAVVRHRSARFLSVASKYLRCVVDYRGLVSFSKYGY